MRIDFTESLDPIPAGQWNRLSGGNPFVRLEFLQALEQAGCVGDRSGWNPCYLRIHAVDDTLVGAVPLYIKTHSYGEYIFDWAWAHAYQNAGLPYYPKLVAAVPFTPATGPRVLLADEVTAAAVLGSVNDSIMALAEELRCSSMHWLFCPEQQADNLQALGYQKRTTYQYHWSNRDYGDFSDFLANLSAKKRKNIRHERRDVENNNIEIEVIPGTSVTPDLWNTFYQFYLDTIRNHGAMPYLNADFFQLLGSTMGEQVRLFIARHQGRAVAGALFLLGMDTLYGRYWGCLESYDKLHFELCYYQAIEYCIRHGLQRFEAGAQGRHKLSRGLVPTPTYSAHWLRHPQFNHAVAEYLQHETSEVNYEMDLLHQRAPFKKTPLP